MSWVPYDATLCILANKLTVETLARINLQYLLLDDGLTLKLRSKRLDAPPRAGGKKKVRKSGVVPVVLCSLAD
jgi:hypothetical protein